MKLRSIQHEHQGWTLFNDFRWMIQTHPVVYLSQNGCRRMTWLGHPQPVNRSSDSYLLRSRRRGIGNSLLRLVELNSETLIVSSYLRKLCGHSRNDRIKMTAWVQYETLAEDNSLSWMLYLEISERRFWFSSLRTDSEWTSFF